MARTRRASRHARAGGSGRAACGNVAAAGVPVPGACLPCRCSCSDRSDRHLMTATAPGGECSGKVNRYDRNPPPGVTDKRTAITGTLFPLVSCLSGTTPKLLSPRQATRAGAPTAEFRATASMPGDHARFRWEGGAGMPVELATAADPKPRSTIRPVHARAPGCKQLRASARADGMPAACS